MGVIELLSMVVPLDTLAGWPTAQAPTALQSLGLLIGIPLLVIILAFVVAKIGNNLKASRGEAPPPAESLWVNGRPGGGEIEAAPELHGVGPDDDVVEHHLAGVRGVPPHLDQRGARRHARRVRPDQEQGDAAAARVAASELRELVVTDSIWSGESDPDSGKIRRLTIAPLLAEAIRRIADESSVSSLFD